MNTNNTIAIKKVLEDACGGTSGPGDEGWKAEGVERLFLEEFGAEGFKGGCVEVRHGENNSESVRMELELAPALAARVLALVTNTTLGELPDLTEPEKAAIESLMTPAPEENVGGEPNAARIMRDERSGYTAAFAGVTSHTVLVEVGAFAEQDRRNKEIADLIMSQRKDAESDDDEKEPVSDDLPPELNFDSPEEKERIPRD